MSLEMARLHLEQAHRTLEGRTLRSASGAYLDVDAAWGELEDAEQRERTPPHELAEAWFDVAHFVVATWAPIAIDVGPGIRDDEERTRWYTLLHNTLRSVFEGYRALNERGQLPGPSIDKIGEECRVLLDTLASFQHAAVA